MPNQHTNTNLQTTISKIYNINNTQKTNDVLHKFNMVQANAYHINYDNTPIIIPDKVLTYKNEQILIYEGNYLFTLSAFPICVVPKCNKKCCFNIVKDKKIQNKMQNVINKQFEAPKIIGSFKCDELFKCDLNDLRIRKARHDAKHEEYTIKKRNKIGTITTLQTLTVYKKGEKKIKNKRKEITYNAINNKIMKFNDYVPIRDYNKTITLIKENNKYFSAYYKSLNGTIYPINEEVDMNKDKCGICGITLTKKNKTYSVLALCKEHKMLDTKYIETYRQTDEFIEDKIYCEKLQEEEFNCKEKQREIYDREDYFLNANRCIRAKKINDYTKGSGMLLRTLNGEKHTATCCVFNLTNKECDNNCCIHAEKNITINELNGEGFSYYNKYFNDYQIDLKNSIMYYFVNNNDEENTYIVQYYNLFEKDRISIVNLSEMKIYTYYLNTNRGQQMKLDMKTLVKYLFKMSEIENSKDWDILNTLCFGDNCEEKVNLNKEIYVYINPKLPLLNHVSNINHYIYEMVKITKEEYLHYLSIGISFNMDKQSKRRTHYGFIVKEEEEFTSEEIRTNILARIKLEFDNIMNSIRLFLIKMKQHFVKKQRDEINNTYLTTMEISKFHKKKEPGNEEIFINVNEEKEEKPKINTPWIKNNYYIVKKELFNVIYKKDEDGNRIVNYGLIPSSYMEDVIIYCTKTAYKNEFDRKINTYKDFKQEDNLKILALINLLIIIEVDENFNNFLKQLDPLMFNMKSILVIIRQYEKPIGNCLKELEEKLQKKYGDETTRYTDNPKHLKQIVYVYNNPNYPFINHVSIKNNYPVKKKYMKKMSYKKFLELEINVYNDQLEQIYSNNLINEIQQNVIITKKATHCYLLNGLMNELMYNKIYSKVTTNCLTTQQLINLITDNNKISTYEEIISSIIVKNKGKEIYLEFIENENFFYIDTPEIIMFTTMTIRDNYYEEGKYYKIFEYDLSTYLNFIAESNNTNTDDLNIHLPKTYQPEKESIDLNEFFKKINEQKHVTSLILSRNTNNIHIHGINVNLNLNEEDFKNLDPIEKYFYQLKQLNGENRISSELQCLNFKDEEFIVEQTNYLVERDDLKHFIRTKCYSMDEMCELEEEEIEMEEDEIQEVQVGITANLLDGQLTELQTEDNYCFKYFRSLYDELGNLPCIGLSIFIQRFIHYKYDQSYEILNLALDYDEVNKYLHIRQKQKGENHMTLEQLLEIEKKNEKQINNDCISQILEEKMNNDGNVQQNLENENYSTELSKEGNEMEEEDEQEEEKFELQLADNVTIKQAKEAIKELTFEKLNIGKSNDTDGWCYLPLLSTRQKLLNDNLMKLYNKSIKEMYEPFISLTKFTELIGERCFERLDGIILKYSYSEFIHMEGVKIKRHVPDNDVEINLDNVIIADYSDYIDFFNGQLFYFDVSNKENLLNFIFFLKDQLPVIFANYVEDVNAAEDIQVGINISQLNASLLTSVNEAMEDVEISNAVNQHERKIFNKALDVKKKHHLCHSSLSTEQIEFLSDEFPSFSIIPADKDKHPHGMHANSRVLCEKSIYKIIGSHIPIFDLGGNYYRHLSESRTNIHSCLRVENSTELSRMTEIDLGVLHEIIKKKNYVFNDRLKEQTTEATFVNDEIIEHLQSGKTNYFCNKDINTCPLVHNFPIACGMSIDALFDVDPFDILSWHQKKKIVVSKHAVTFNYAMLYEKKGNLPFNEGNWEINEEGQLRMTLIQSDDVYINNFENFKKYLINKMFVGNKSGIYIKIEGVRACHLRIDIYSVPEVFITRNMLLKSIWFSNKFEDVILTLPIINTKLPYGLFGKLNASAIDPITMFKENNDLYQDFGEETDNLFNKDNVNAQNIISSILMPQNDEYDKPTGKISEKKYDLDKRFILPHELFTVETVVVNTKLLNLLVTRLMWASSEKKIDLWKDLLEYMRTLKFQLFVTSVSQMNRFKEDPYLFLKHGIFALYTHYGMFQKLSPIINTMSTSKNRNFLSNVYSALVNILTDVLKTIDPINIEEIKEFLLKYGDKDDFKLTSLFEANLEGLEQLPIISTHNYNNVIIMSQVTKNDLNNEEITWDCKPAFIENLKSLVTFAKDTNNDEEDEDSGHKCTHICINKNHSFYRSLGGVFTTCTCCEKVGYCINEKCYCCSSIEYCCKGWGSECKATHLRPSEHCCNSDNCKCVKNVMCKCCKNLSISEICPLCKHNCMKGKKVSIEPLTQEMSDSENEEEVIDESITKPFNSELDTNLDTLDFNDLSPKEGDPFFNVNKPLYDEILNTVKPKTDFGYKPVINTSNENERTVTPVIKLNPINKQLKPDFRPTKNYKSTEEEEKPVFIINELLSKELNEKIGNLPKSTYSTQQIIKVTKVIKGQIAGYVDLDMSNTITWSWYREKILSDQWSVKINRIHQTAFDFIFDHYKSEENGLFFSITLNMKNFEHKLKANNLMKQIPLNDVSILPISQIICDGKKYLLHSNIMVPVLIAGKILLQQMLVLKALRIMKEKKITKVEIIKKIGAVIFELCYSSLLERLSSDIPFMHAYDNAIKKIKARRLIKGAIENNMSQNLIKNISVRRGIELSLLEKAIEQNPIILDIDKTITKLSTMEIRTIPNKIYCNINNIKITYIEDNSGDGLCGWYAIKNVFKFNDEVLNELQLSTGKLENWNSVELGNFIIKKQLNIIIISVYSIMSYRGNNSNIFGGILHTNLYNEATNHWQGCMLEVLYIKQNEYLFNNDIVNASLVNYLMRTKPLLFVNKSLKEIMDLDFNILQTVDWEEVESEIEDTIKMKLLKLKQTDELYSKSIVHNNYLTYTTEIFDDSNKIEKFMTKLNENVILLYAPCSFGKTLKAFDHFNKKRLILVIPLRKSVNDAYDQYIKKYKEYSIAKRHSGKTVSNVEDLSLKNKHIVIITVDSMVNALQNKHIDLKTYNTIMFDEIHDRTVNYLNLIALTNKIIKYNNINIRVVFSTATYSPKYIVPYSRYPIEINDYYYPEDIPIKEEGVTAILISGEHAANKIYNQHFGHLAYGTEIKYVDSHILNENPKIFETGKVFLCTNCISVGTNIPNLDTVIDLADRLVVETSYLCEPTEKKYYSSELRYHSLSEKYQTQRRIGRFKKGKYYGCVRTEPEYLTLQDWLSFNSVVDIELPMDLKQELNMMKDLQKKYNSVDDVIKRLKEWNLTLKDPYEEDELIRRAENYHLNIIVESRIFTSKPMKFSNRYSLTEKVSYDELFNNLITNNIMSKPEKQEENKHIIMVNKIAKKLDIHTLIVNITKRCETCNELMINNLLTHCNYCDKINCGLNLRIEDLNDFTTNCQNVKLNFNIFKSDYKMMDYSDLTIYNFYTNNNSQIQAEYIKYFINSIQKTIKSMCDIAVKPWSEDRRNIAGIIRADLNGFDKNIKSLFSYYNLRNGEIICYITNNKAEINMVGVETNLNKNEINHILISQNKTYYMKLYLANLLVNPKDFKKIDNYIKQAKIVHGVAGSGKTKIIEDASNNVVIVNQELIRKQLNNNLKLTRVYTSTASMLALNTKKVKKLYIDEINTINTLDLRLIIPNNVEELYLMGDKYQFPSRDYDIITAHDEKAVNILEDKPFNQGMNKSNRLGDNTCDILRSYQFNIIGIKDKKDVIRTFIYNKTEKNFDYNSLIKTEEYDLVLVQNVGMISNFGLKSKNVTTVIKSEGIQKQKVCLIIDSLDQNLSDRRFIYTALTRHQKQIDIFIESKTLINDNVKKLTLKSDIGGENLNNNEILRTLLTNTLEGKNKNLRIFIENGKKIVIKVKKGLNKFNEFLIKIIKYITNKLHDFKVVIINEFEHLIKNVHELNLKDLTFLHFLNKNNIEDEEHNDYEEEQENDWNASFVNEGLNFDFDNLDEINNYDIWNNVEKVDQSFEIKEDTIVDEEQFSKKYSYNKYKNIIDKIKNVTSDEAGNEDILELTTFNSMLNRMTENLEKFWNFIKKIFKKFIDLSKKIINNINQSFWVIYANIFKDMFYTEIRNVIIDSLWNMISIVHSRKYKLTEDMYALLINKCLNTHYKNVINAIKVISYNSRINLELENASETFFKENPIYELINAPFFEEAIYFALCYLLSNKDKEITEIMRKNLILICYKMMHKMDVSDFFLSKLLKIKLIIEKNFNEKTEFPDEFDIIDLIVNNQEITDRYYDLAISILSRRPGVTVKTNNDVLIDELKTTRSVTRTNLLQEKNLTKYLVFMKVGKQIPYNQIKDVGEQFNINKTDEGGNNAITTNVKIFGCKIKKLFKRLINKFIKMLSGLLNIFKGNKEIKMDLLIPSDRQLREAILDLQAVILSFTSKIENLTPQLTNVYTKEIWRSECNFIINHRAINLILISKKFENSPFLKIMNNSLLLLSERKLINTIMYDLNNLFNCLDNMKDRLSDFAGNEQQIDNTTKQTLIEDYSQSLKSYVNKWFYAEKKKKLTRKMAILKLMQLNLHNELKKF